MLLLSSLIACMFVQSLPSSSRAEEVISRCRDSQEWFQHARVVGVFEQQVQGAADQAPRGRRVDFEYACYERDAAVRTRITHIVIGSAPDVEPTITTMWNDDGARILSFAKDTENAELSVAWLYSPRAPKSVKTEFNRLNPAAALIGALQGRGETVVERLERAARIEIRRDEPDVVVLATTDRDGSALTCSFDPRRGYCLIQYELSQAADASTPAYRSIAQFTYERREEAWLPMSVTISSKGVGTTSDVTVSVQEFLRVEGGRLPSELAIQIPDNVTVAVEGVNDDVPRIWQGGEVVTAASAGVAPRVHTSVEAATREEAQAQDESSVGVSVGTRFTWIVAGVALASAISLAIVVRRQRGARLRRLSR